MNNSDSIQHLNVVLPDSVKVTLQKEILNSLERVSVSRSEFELIYLPIILTAVAASAVIVANVLIAHRSKVDSLRSNRLTLHLAWATDFRRSVAMFMNRSFQAIEDLYKVHLVAYLANNEELRLKMKERINLNEDSTNKIRENLRNSTLEASEAACTLRLLFDSRDQASIDISKHVGRVLDIINMEIPIQPSLDHYNQWKKDITDLYGKVTLDLANKTTAYLREKEETVLRDS